MEGSYGTETKGGECFKKQDDVVSTGLSTAEATDGLSQSCLGSAIYPHTPGIELRLSGS